MKNLGAIQDPKSLVNKEYADNIVAVSTTQPTAAENKLWVDTDAGSGTSYQIPTEAEMQAADAQMASELGIVVNGNATALGASEGQYIILRNSTISGCADGLYTAAQAIPANTAINATYLSGPIMGGGLNDLTDVYIEVGSPNTNDLFDTTDFHYAEFKRCGKLCICTFGGLVKSNLTVINNLTACPIPSRFNPAGTGEGIAMSTVENQAGRIFISGNNICVYFGPSADGYGYIFGSILYFAIN